MTPPLVAVRGMICVPGSVRYTDGFVSVDVPDEVPKAQANVVPDMGVVVFVKLSKRGAQPDVGVTVNPAVSASALVTPRSIIREINKVLNSFIAGIF